MTISKIKPATPPGLVKQALITSIAKLCSPPKSYDTYHIYYNMACEAVGKPLQEELVNVRNDYNKLN